MSVEIQTAKKTRIKELEEWSSVKDSLPEPSDIRLMPYLAIHAGWDHHATIILWDSVDLKFTKNGDDTQKVTHWMPLPKNPVALK